MNYVETRAIGFKEIHCFAMQLDLKNKQAFYHIGQWARENKIVNMCYKNILEKAVNWYDLHSHQN